MSNQAVQQRLPKYRPDLFADRRRPIKRVIGAVRKLLDGAPLHSILAFRGGRGLGKSWLALHVARTVVPEQYKGTVLSLFIGLGRNYRRDVIELDDRRDDEWLLEDNILNSANGLSQNESTLALHALMIWLASRIGAIHSVDAPIDQLATWIVNRLKQPKYGTDNQYQALVCVIDSAYEADDLLRRQLEHALLDSLAQLPRVLLVMTGRGNVPKWSSASVILYHTPINLDDLKEDVYELHEGRQTKEKPPLMQQLLIEQQQDALRFTSAITESIGKEQTPEHIHDLLRKASWLPLNAVLISLIEEHIISWEQGFDELLHFIEEREQRSKVRNSIIALSILEGFSDSELHTMLTTNDAFDDASLLEPSVFRTLVIEKHRLAAWDAKEGQTRLDKSIRSFAHLYLHEADQQLLVVLHQMARDMYFTWADLLDDDHYRERAEYHAEQVRLSTTQKDVSSYSEPDVRTKGYEL